MEIIKLVPINTRSFTTYPLPESGEGVIEVTAEEYEKLKNQEVCFSDDLKSVVPCEKPERKVRNAPKNIQTEN